MKKDTTGGPRNERFGKWTGIVLLLSAGIVTLSLAFPTRALAGMHKLNFRCNFSPKELSEWVFPHPEDWVSRTENGKTYLHLIRSRPPGVPRRPLQFARLKGVNVGNFDLRVKVRKEGTALLIIFGYVDTLHFYYAHLSRDRGTRVPVHNGIFIVDGGPRRRIAGLHAPPALPDTQWHTIRIVRNVRTGLIQVYSDIQKKPIFSVVDRHFTCGQIGLGSFDGDEIGDFADLRLRSDDAGCTPHLPATAQTLLRDGNY